MLIFLADLHLMDGKPKCRTDYFTDSMKTKILYILDFAMEHEATIFIAGDVCHKWKLSPELEGWFINAIKEREVKIFAIPGQHDLPNHNINRIEESSYYVFMASGVIENIHEYGGLFNDTLVVPFGWNVELDSVTVLKNRTRVKIALCHHFVYKGKEPWPGASETHDNTKRVMKKLKGFDYIICGDNHESFTEKVKDQVLINCGSVTRTTAKQVDHEPCFWVLDDHTHMEPHYIPIKEDVISREHIEIEKEREDRVQAYVEKIKSELQNMDIDLDFVQNVRDYYKKNKTKSPITAKLEEALSV